MSTANTNANTNTNTNPYKRMKLDDDTKDSTTNTKPLIATHSGTFQADEALGVWLLRQTRTYRNSPVLRTRNPEEYSKADVVIDVGGVYDHGKKLYDHHQRDYDERFAPRVKTRGRVDPITKEEVEVRVQVERCTKLSASGLVYRHYGREIIGNYYPGLKEEELEMVYEKMYDRFLEPIDAIDTGVEPVPKKKDDRDGTDTTKNESEFELLYHDNTGLSTRVGRLNPRWNEESTSTPDQRFEQASAMCGRDFMSALVPMVESELPARAIVEAAVLGRHDVDPSGEVVKFPNGGLPWKKHLYDLEVELKISPLVKFVLYTDQSGMWRIQAVTVKGQAFENRLSLPEEWRGVRDEDLEKVAGIKGCKFCHASGFIGGNETFEGALEMARVALSRKVGDD